MNLAIVIPMKDPALSKTRLSGHLMDATRQRLALAIFEHTLAFFRESYPGLPVMTITASACIAQSARQLGAGVIHEPSADGLNAAAALAADWAALAGYRSLLIVPSDIPVLLRSEIDQLLSLGTRHQAVIAESIDGGTNALLLSPPDCLPFYYGPGSALIHYIAVCCRQLRGLRVQLTHLSRDVDTPQDLLMLRDVLPTIADRTGALMNDCGDTRELTHKTAAAQRPSMRLFALSGLPDIEEADSLDLLIFETLEMMDERLRPGDILVVTQKIVSKSEGQMLCLSQITPSSQALELAERTGKDPRKAQAILDESSAIMRVSALEPDGLIVARHRHGWVCANAGIDESNLDQDADEAVLLLPQDPDRSARRLRRSLENAYGGPIGVVISDTFGRAWRKGQVNVAIGTAGVPALTSLIGERDAYGRELRVTQPALADELAAAAGLLMDKAARTPVVVVRGLTWSVSDTARAGDVVRPIEEELFP